MNLNIQMKEFLELEAFKRLRSSSAKNQLNVNSHNPIKLFLDVLIVIVIPLGCDHSWFDTRPGLTSWQCHSSMSHVTNKLTQAGCQVTRIMTTKCLECNNIRMIIRFIQLSWKVFMYIHFLYFNADMSLTCIQKFLVILIYETNLISKLFECSEVRFMQ